MYNNIIITFLTFSFLVSLPRPFSLHTPCLTMLALTHCPRAFTTTSTPATHTPASYHYHRFPLWVGIGPSGSHAHTFCLPALLPGMFSHHYPTPPWIGWSSISSHTWRFPSHLHAGTPSPLLPHLPSYPLPTYPCPAPCLPSPMEEGRSSRSPYLYL